MKKLLLVLPVVSLAACGTTEQTLISGCEKIAATDASAVYKCPVSEELTAIQAMEANSMFLEPMEGVDMQAIAADAENVYVNVVAEDKCEQEGQVAYRVMVKNPTIDGKTWYSVSVCK